MDDHVKRVLLHAQLDIKGLLDFATTVADSYNKDAAIETLKELQQLTGDPAGQEFTEGE